MIVTLCSGSCCRDVRATQRVAGLVIGGQLLLVLGHHHRAPLGAHHDLVLGVLRTRAIVTERLPRRAASSAASLTRLARSAPEKPGVPRAMTFGVDIRRQRHLAHMDLEDLLAADDVGVRHHDLAVEAARPQQRRVEHVGPVGGGDQDHALVRLEAVHLDQQLVEGLLALVVAAAEAGAAMAADRVDLVDEDDAGRVLLALLEHVAHAAGADADEHLDEIRAGDREERHVRLAGDGAGEQGLAGAGRADQQHALRDLAAEALEFLRVLQELDDLLELAAWPRRCRRRPRR